MDKKNNIIIVIAIILLIVLIVFLTIYKNNNTIDENIGLKEISYTELKKKINNKEDVIVLFSQTTCSHCAKFKPILREVATTYDLTIYYIDYDIYEKETATEILDYFNFNGATPTTIFFKEGKELSVMNRLVGSKQKSTVIAALEKLEYIKTE